MRYENVSSRTLLGDYPRAVYAITLERRAGYALSYAMKLVSWPGVVQSVIDRVGASPYGIPLGGPMPSTTDAVAVIEIRAPSNPASGDSVGDLVRVADSAGGARVVAITRLGPVPAASSPDATERKKLLEAEQARAAKEAKEGTLANRLQRAVRSATLPVGVGVGVAILALGIIYGGPILDRIGKGAKWE